jgi:hypothetical protein
MSQQKQDDRQAAAFRGDPAGAPMHPQQKARLIKLAPACSSPSRRTIETPVADRSYQDWKEDGRFPYCGRVPFAEKSQSGNPGEVRAGRPRIAAQMVIFDLKRAARKYCTEALEVIAEGCAATTCRCVSLQGR